MRFNALSRRHLQHLPYVAAGLAVAGVGCLAPAAGVVGSDDAAITWLWRATAMLLASGVAAFGGIWATRRDIQRLARALRKEAACEWMEPLDVHRTSLRRLTEAANEVIATAQRMVGDAQMQVKSHAIQLKVVTAERQHAEAIIKSISDAVLVTSPFDEVVLANDSAAKTFDFDLKQSTRKPVDRLLKDERFVELLREMRQSRSVNGRRVIEHEVRGANGCSAGGRTYKVTLSGVADSAGEPGGVVAVLHDMTREREVAQMKNDFVSNVSHELRTPLASIKAYVEMLIDGEAEDERTKIEFYEIIQGESNRLGRLIDNILNISRIESGLVKISKLPQSISVIVKEACDVIVPQAKLKQIAIVEQLCPVFYQTLADRDMLYQAVLNILSNSVKYTPDGGQVTVQTSVDEARRKLFLRIIDTGVGIPAKDLPFVFDKFYRVESNNRMAKGTGLGLSLVKHIVETVHGGRATVTSEVGKGTRFEFELDLCE
jgi:two-component system phosphate regulon sensor histidine kinase PhoR